MRNIFFVCLLILSTACGTNDNNETATDSTTNTTRGNSAGSDIIARDSARMDTSSGSISTDSL